MNLHQIVAGAIGAVNPFVPASVQVSSGYTTNPDFSRTPNYTTLNISAQVQALTYQDLTHLDGLNIQGVRRAIYTNGSIMGLVRIDAKGGDVITFAPGLLPEGDAWLCAHVLEQWSDGGNGASWCKICITLQNDSSSKNSTASTDFTDPNNAKFVPGLT
jgi:hypothetical protein